MTDALDHAAQALREYLGPEDSMAPDDYLALMVKAVLRALYDPTPEMIQAAANTPGMREVQDVLSAAFARRLSSPGLRYEERGEEVPLVQAWKAMIREVCGGEEP